MRRLTGKVTAALAGAVVLTGCAVGTAYKKPVTPVPPAIRGAEAQPAAASFGDLPWREVFRDPVLQKLIETGIGKNYDLQLASERITAAQEQVAIAHAGQLPSVTGGATYSGGQSTGSTMTVNLLALTGNASYQTDFFHSLRNTTEAARAQLLATEEARRTVIVSLVSDIATNYYQLLSADAQLRIAKETIAAGGESLRLTKLRLEHGTATQTDVMQSQQVVDAANARIPDLERQAGLYENAISTLLGGFPEATPRGAALGEQYLAPEVPAGLPSSLLERRPDIRQAEKTLIYYNAQLNVAKAALYPQLTLTGSFGPSAIFTSLANSYPFIHNLTASLVQSVFDAGSRRAKVRLAESQQRQSLLTYAQTVQKAFGEVSSALIEYNKYHELYSRQNDVVTTLRNSQRLATLRYQGGITTYLEVLDAQRSLFAAQLTLAQDRGLEYQSVVKVYRTLGGGWQ